MRNIRLSDHSIYIEDIWSNFKDLIENYDHIVVLTDINSRAYCLKEFEMLSELKKFDIITIPTPEQQEKEGTTGENLSVYYIEQFKNQDSCSKIFDRLLECGADRHSLLINLGGGVICDMGGYCASVFMRGMDFIHFPTTLLSQVDASVGGKLGINYRGYKNMVGLFRNPIGVFIHDKFLESLPERELRSGFAEIVKHALTLNYNLWEQLKEMEDIEISNLLPLIEKSIIIKKQIVQTDPTETGKRKVLNFGHTLGHALETSFLKKGEPITHGEAVAAGMAMECYLSMLHYRHDEDWLASILVVLKRFFPKIDIGDKMVLDLLQLIRVDKKNKAGVPHFTFLIDIGNVEYDQIARAKDIRAAVEYYRKNY